ncbi:hypothetical protein DAERI_130074 [Deinococcus aerius]|uniref:Uncharacterized protein n=1 Tax=Deinococcus aerius TaxID=200253 RepID=A0A2I9CYL1_9DEIO|nr:hypothetical protein [Deinococcus aerius]GBF07244.1 hypothetical protein DAERI_130074 [Deinococcus aerius]
MPIPLVIIGIAAAGAIKKGIDAGGLLMRASELQKETNERKGKAEGKFEDHLQAVRHDALALEEQKHAVMAGTMARFVELWERQKKRANVSDKDFTVRLNISAEKLEEFRGIGVKSLEIAGGLASATAAGVGTGATVISAVSAFGVASTGTAISGLSGAAANSALLAWLGGGSLAAGGGGMALGTIVAGGLFVAPAALVGSFIAAKKGQEALTAATEYQAKVDVYIAELQGKQTHLTAIQERMTEVSDLITALVQRLRNALTLCERDEARMEGNVRLENFYAAATLAKTLSELLSVPIIDEHIQAAAASQAVVAQAYGSL